MTTDAKMNRLGRELVKLIREHFRLQAEVRTLAATLQTAVLVNQPPHGWLDALKLARKTPEYRNISEQYEPQIAAFEQALDAKEAEVNWDDLLKTIPPTQFLN